MNFHSDVLELKGDGKGNVKGHPCAGTEGLYRPYGSYGE